MTQTNVRVQMQIRRDTAANWNSADPILLIGEWGYETDSGKIKIGDGATAWSFLDYAFVSTKGGNMPDHLTIHNKKELRLSDNTQSTAADHYSAFKAGTQSADLTYTLPTALPTSSGQVLSCTDAGVMSWASDSTTDSSKMPLAGGTCTGDVIFDGATAGRDITYDRSADNLTFSDDAKASFGSSDSLKIYHNGTNSFVNNLTGYLRVKNENDGQIYLQSNSEIRLAGENNDETFGKFIKDGAVQLFYDGGATPKLETVANGIKTQANLFLNDSTNGNIGRIKLGDGQDLQIFHTGATTQINNTTGSLLLQSDDLRLRDKTNGHSYLEADVDGSVELYYDNAKKFQTTSNGA